MYKFDTRHNIGSRQVEFTHRHKSFERASMSWSIYAYIKCLRVSEITED